MIKHMGEADFPSQHGNFRIHSFVDSKDREHIALVSNHSTLNGGEVPVRIHSKCLTGDTLASLRCDCRNQLEIALGYIGKNGGILIYLDQEGRGIGLPNKIKCYSLQDSGLDTVEANLELGFGEDLRTYEAAAQILNYFGVTNVALLTNNPEKIKELESHKIKVGKRIPIITSSNDHNCKYLQTKKEKLNHLL